MEWPHIMQMADSRLPRQLLYEQLADGKQLPHEPKRQLKDFLKISLEDPVSKEFIGM